MDQYQYRLLEPKDDYKEAVIEKAGITATFTIAEVEAMQERNQKGLREAEGQIKIEEAKMANVEHFHPEVKDMPGEKLAAVAIYYDSMGMIERARKAKEALEAAIKQNGEMIDIVMQQMGFQPAVDPITSEPDDHGKQDQQNSEGQS